MTKLTDHFTLEEFTRSDAAKALGDANEPTLLHLDNLGALARFLERVRVVVGRPLRIKSAYRNPRVNAHVGGVPNSDHANGLAADIIADDMDSYDLAKMIERSALQFDQLIYEKSRGVVHLGMGKRMRRDVLTQAKGPGTPFVLGIVR